MPLPGEGRQQMRLVTFMRGIAACELSDRATRETTAWR